MRKLQSLMVLLSVFVFVYCTKKEEETKPNTNTSTSLKINYTVKDYYIVTVSGQQQQRDSLVAGAQVRVYATEANRDANTNHIHSSTSSANGTGSITVGEKKTYYLRAVHPVNGQIAKDQVSFTANVSATNPVLIFP